MDALVIVNGMGCYKVNNCQLKLCLDNIVTRVSSCTVSVTQVAQIFSYPRRTSDSFLCFSSPRLDPLFGRRCFYFSSRLLSCFDLVIGGLFLGRQTVFSQAAICILSFLPLEMTRVTVATTIGIICLSTYNRQSIIECLPPIGLNVLTPVGCPTTSGPQTSNPLGNGIKPLHILVAIELLSITCLVHYPFPISALTYISDNSNVRSHSGSAISEQGINLETG